MILDNNRVDDDLGLVEKASRGDRMAFADLVRKHEVKVRGTCRAILGDFALADDAAQEVFIKIHRSLADFRQDSLFSTWLYRVTINHCRDELRKAKRHKHQSLEQLIEEKGSSVELAAATQAPTSSGVMDAREQLSQVLESLSPEYREVIVLREIRELSYQEISQTLNCSLDAVKARLKRARQYLQENLRHIRSSTNVDEDRGTK